MVKVKELRELVTKLKGEKTLETHTVEFVLDAKKYFASNVKAGTDTMTIEITRDNYHPLTVDSLEQTLNIAGGDLEVNVLQGKNGKTITEHFVTDSAVEFVLG